MKESYFTIEVRMFLDAPPLSQNNQYLRLSLTDDCNFRCIYCLPHNNTETKAPRILLSNPEFTRLVRAFAKLGVRKVRLTGGEPGLRSDLLEIAQSIAKIPEIRELTLSTNGTALFPRQNESAESRIQFLREAGISRVNVSLDSLNPSTFAQISARNLHARVLESIYASISAGFPTKINCVVLKNHNSNELDLWKDFVKKFPVTVRFIELMPTKGSEQIFQTRNFPLGSWIENTVQEGWQEVAKDSLAGPAREFSHPAYLGKLGFITPVSHKFCDSCNRLRATSMGSIHTCAFSSSGHNIRHLLQSPLQENELMQTLAHIVSKKVCGSEPSFKASLFTQSFSRLGG